VSARENVRLTLALDVYDHVRDLVSGLVPVQGVDLTCLTLPVEEIFYRFTRFREWEVSELSLAKYCALRSRGDDSLFGLPVFTSRVFRHSAFFIRPDGPVDDPGSLRRIGIPEWTVTATVYGRAILEHEFGVRLRDVTWIQGGVNEPGRIETLEVEPPDGVRVERVAGRSLEDLLLAGEIDAILAPHPPSGFGTGRLVRLFSDPRGRELESFERTGVFPIMHLVVVRADVYDAHPWIAQNLVTAFSVARDRSVARARDPNVSHFPLTWPLPPSAADAWPYGVEPNRTTLSAFLRYAYEQGVCARPLEPEDLFAESVRASFRV
jgi:4,5-dihydroxyphthalate decarboxylase